ncbi:MAG: phenylalanine--tRNA ligase subunit alpha [Patescibacteria group bacterium]
MKSNLEKLKNEILESLKDVKNSKVLRDLEVKYLGRKGELSKILRNLKNLDNKQKKEIGQLANVVKKELQEKFMEVKSILEGGSKKEEFIDVTLPGEKIERGHLHPITQVQNELEDLFMSMGFMVLDGPELESDYYNFEALNIPRYHPARDMQDTFYIDKKNEKGEYDLLMRTQTSPMQIRAMEKYGAPLRCIIPGRVFRCEATDACHEHTLYQLEGLMVDEGISVANLISVVKEMLGGIFKHDIKIRVRPGYFPFVEPGLEFDMDCQVCGGKGCPSCKYSGWVEMMGSGMVHPDVLRAGGVDPKKYSGFAFGMGIDRLTMMKYGINEIRLFESGDLRFLSQF